MDFTLHLLAYFRMHLLVQLRVPLRGTSGEAPKSALRDLFIGVPKGLFDVLNERLHLKLKLSST